MQTYEAAFPWLTVLILVALVAALVLWLVRPLHKVARPFGLIVSIVIFAGFVAAAATSFDVARAGEVQMAELYSWIPQIGTSIAWGVNGMGLVMIGLATFLVPLVILASYAQLDDETDSRAAGYIAWVLFLESIMIGIFAARDVLLFYILFEVMLIPVFFLIGRYGGPRRQRAAMKFLVYSLVGGLVMLVGVVAVYAYGPGGPQGFLIDNMAGAISGSKSVQMLLFLSFFFAFAVKAPMFPVHTWLPDATEQAPAGTSTLLVGVLDKIGTFGMIAICLPLFPDAAGRAAAPIMVLAVISILWGGFMAIASKDLMRLIAYTSVSHFGFMILGIFSGNSVAMTGTILYMVAHGVATGALFLTVGFLARRGGSQKIADYGGWQRVTPLIAGTFLIAGLASIALPGLSGFIPEYLILVGTYKVHAAYALFAVLGVILAALYILLAYQKVFTGPRPDVKVKDMDGKERIVSGILIAAMLFLGFAPASVLDVIRPVAESSAELIVTPVATDGAAAVPADAAVANEGSAL
ncbi:MAG: NADH-quinone oxidoreductase subunit M [Ancrocorticia sp.]|jgi:NADH dehydrogenase subunit M (EC 1.6.5.3)|nr:NADH-quinone oxidoreductase subunit M [Ancrocorticia sp.]MCI1895556.1 NADH-quinone oxidoreductase subunit M [Ancrocorticia sp.]MCI1932339.1 NADH-quinone oxidoreductase subunit M [Ancrocorticia sp.]MCI2177960.1 NADH-quinone oxidoreductase subunit M [Ancrocorticia sp.]MCI2192973.1 NADH-quinone oxidoreductase subunit M [Ancrocorticia sp.]